MLQATIVEPGHYIYIYTCKSKQGVLGSKGANLSVCTTSGQYMLYP